MGFGLEIKKLIAKNWGSNAFSNYRKIQEKLKS